MWKAGHQLSRDGCQLLGIADFNWNPMHESQWIYNISIVNLILQILMLIKNYMLATTDKSEVRGLWRNLIQCNQEKQVKQEYK